MNCTAIFRMSLTSLMYKIMSPNFVMQPEVAVVVTEDNWYAAPAEKPENKQRE